LTHRQQQRRVGGERAVVDIGVLGVQLAQVRIRPQVVAQAHDSTHLCQRLCHGGCGARGVEHLDLLRERGLLVPLGDPTRRGHLLGQRERARRVRGCLASEESKAHVGERLVGLLGDRQIDSRFAPSHDLVIVHVLPHFRRRHLGSKAGVVVQCAQMIECAVAVSWCSCSIVCRH